MAEPVTKEQIITASWALLAAQGMAAFSMRQLAKQVGLSASTLYWHFKNKDAIFAALIDQVCEEALATFTTQTTWQDQLVADGLTLATCLRQRPAAAELLLSTPPTTEHYLRVNERFLQDVDALTLNDTEKFTIVSIFLNFILTYERDYQLQATHRPVHPGHGATPAGLADTPILKRLFDQGLFQSLGTPATLAWSLTTLILGFDQRQRS